jgi:hypothetical protein
MENFMKNQDKFSSALWFMAGAAFLFFALMQFALALTWRPLDNHFLGGVVGIPLAMLLTLLFMIGWWFGWIFEAIISNQGRKIMLWFLLGVILVYLVIALLSFLMPVDLSRFALVASDSIVLSGIWFRISRVRPETLAKLRNRN